MPDIDAKKIEELRGLLAKATPGPWVFLELTTNPDGVGYIQRKDHDGKEIAHHGDMSRSRDENCANAALIVTAVNSLSALLDLAERASIPLAGDVEITELEELAQWVELNRSSLPAYDRDNADAIARVLRDYRSLAGRVEAEKRAKEDALEWATVWHKCVETALTILETNPDLEADEAPRAIQERVANLQRAEYDQRLLREAAETRSAALAGRVEASEQTVRIILKESDVYPEGQG